MLSRRLVALPPMLNCKANQLQSQRHVQVSIIGAGSSVGWSLAMLMKHNDRVSRLKLYDNDPKVMGIALELNQLPSGPPVIGYTGEDELKEAIAFSKLILMVSRTMRLPAISKSEMITVNAPEIQKLCKAIAERNPDAFLGISTDPINGITPLACALLHKYNVFNPARVFGITNIDSVRTKSYVAYYLGANPRHLSIPVIGGHSENTIVPLFSNLSPQFYVVDVEEALILTRMLKKYENDSLHKKQEKNNAILAMTWAINDFAEKLVEALWGDEVEVHSYTANPHFGTRFFSGPTRIGPYGIVRTCSNFPMSHLECNLLSDAVPYLNEDISLGEGLSRNFE